MADFFKKNFLAFSILVSALLISGALLYSTAPGIFNFERSRTTASVGTLPEIGDLPFLGEANAKVTIVEFGDYQCPFCERFFQETEPQIIENYVRTGKVKFAWRDFAFLGEESFWAAEAARCANDQGKFWEYHNILFERQAGENQGAFSKANLKVFAGDIGLNENEFSTCLDSGKYRAEVESDSRAASAFGVNSTPTVFINDKKIVGALPFSSFQEVIEVELK